MSYLAALTLLCDFIMIVGFLIECGSKQLRVDTIKSASGGTVVALYFAWLVFLVKVAQKVGLVYMLYMEGKITESIVEL